MSNPVTAFFASPAPSSGSGSMTSVAARRVDSFGKGSNPQAANDFTVDVKAATPVKAIAADTGFQRGHRDKAAQEFKNEATLVLAAKVSADSDSRPSLGFSRGQ